MNSSRKQMSHRTFKLVMDAPEYFFSCDWGTTYFRLRLAKCVGEGLEVVDEIRTGEGVKPLHDQITRANRPSDAAARGPVFAGYLASRVHELRIRCHLEPADLPVVVSGMASSSIGWKELPYARAPLPLTAKALVTDRVRPSPQTSTSVILVSGVRTECDIMRGEETELLGLLAMPEFQSMATDGVVLMPGTHSKRVRICENRLEEFHTFMTGELYEVLTRHSILSASLPAASTDNAIAKGNQADLLEAPFLDGVRAGTETALAQALFRVRTRAVLDGQPAASNASFLSGLLIGAEVADLVARYPSGPILLAAGHPLDSAYRMALEWLATDRPVRAASPESLRLASLYGHARILQGIHE